MRARERWEGVCARAQVLLVRGCVRGRVWACVCCACVCVCARVGACGRVWACVCGCARARAWVRTRLGQWSVPTSAVPTSDGLVKAGQSVVNQTVLLRPALSTEPYARRPWGVVGMVGVWACGRVGKRGCACKRVAGHWVSMTTGKRGTARAPLHVGAASLGFQGIGLGVQGSEFGVQGVGRAGARRFSRQPANTKANS